MAESSTVASNAPMETWKKVAIGVGGIGALAAAILLPLLLLRDSSETTSTPSLAPSLQPSTLVPTTNPSFNPTTIQPTTAPSSSPTDKPTFEPTTVAPTSPPTTLIYSFGGATETACPDLTLTLNVTTNSSTTNSTFNSTSTTIISSNSSTWIQIADDIYGENALDFSGAALAVSANGRIIAVSSTENDGNGRNSGSVRVYMYNYTYGDFVQLGQEIDGENEGDWSGESLALDARGYRLAVGAGWNDGVKGEDSGHVRVFDYSEKTDSWDLTDSDLDGPNEGVEFGKSVSLSADGNRLLVGASHCRGDANMTRLGCAFLFDFVNGSWSLFGQMEGEAEGDEFGTTVELSADGLSLAIGAYRHDVINGTDAGQVALYAFNSSTDAFESNGVIEGVLPGEWAGMAFSLSESGHRVAVGCH
eukprot:Sro500_g155180.4  (417) ;mRNA; f:1549-2801